MVLLLGPKQDLFRLPKIREALIQSTYKTLRTFKMCIIIFTPIHKYKYTTSPKFSKPINLISLLKSKQSCMDIITGEHTLAPCDYSSTHHPFNDLLQKVSGLSTCNFKTRILSFFMMTDSIIPIQ